MKFLLFITLYWYEYSPYRHASLQGISWVDLHWVSHPSRGSGSRWRWYTGRPCWGCPRASRSGTLNLGNMHTSPRNNKQSLNFYQIFFNKYHHFMNDLHFLLFSLFDYSFLIDCAVTGSIIENYLVNIMFFLFRKDNSCEMHGNTVQILYSQWVRVKPGYINN